MEEAIAILESIEESDEYDIRETSYTMEQIAKAVKQLKILNKLLQKEF